MPRLEWPLHVVLRVVGTVLALALVAGAGGWGYHWWQRSRDRCADGVTRAPASRECVGVTDGSYPFTKGFAPVERLIARENAHVAGEPHVSVAYLTSYTLTDEDSNSEASVRHELEGAYLAQYRFNEGDLRGSPKIRLLLANAGSESASWRHTVDELIARRDTDHLVAVAGLGPSTDRDKAAQRRLAAHGIATVASIMTATDIGGTAGFARVAPTNRDEAAAGAAFLKKEPAYRTGVVVQDAAGSDLYARTLGDAFTAAFPDSRHRLTAQRLTYDSSVRNAWQNELRYIADQLCDYRPDVVYFAGRGRQLTHFLDALGSRPCQDRRFSVLTGDDTTNLSPADLARHPHHGVTVLYTGLAHPDMWKKNPGAVSARSAAFFAKGGPMDKWFPDDPLEDGQAIVGHDAVLTAAQGVYLAAGDGGQEVDGRAVGRMFQQMRGSRQVPGAGGFLSFDSRGDPRDKAVPVLRITGNGHSELVAVSSPDGAPRQRER